MGFSMTDIASISLRVDTGDIQRGNNELDKFQKSAVSAAGAADEFNASGEDTAKVARTAASSVGTYSQRLRDTGTTTKALTQETARQQQELRALLTQINPVTAAFEKLDNMERQLSKFSAKGLVDTETFNEATRAIEKTRLELDKASQARTEEGRAAAEEARQSQKAEAQRATFLKQLKDQTAAMSLSREELLRYRAAELGVSSAADIYIKKMSAASNATHGFSLQSAAARRELGVLAGELARGNFGALRSSGITLANRSGLLEQLFSLRGLAIAGSVGAIATAVTALGVAWYQGSKEAEEFNKQLILTGNYAGKDASQLQDMAKDISRIGVTQAAASAALAKVVGSGSFRGDQLKTVTEAAVAMQEATGRAVGETIKDFQKLYAEPTKGSAELNSHMHYLTASQYQYIDALERRGDKEAAGDESARLYSEAEQKRNKQLIDNLSGLDRLIHDVTSSWKGFWDAALDIGRGQSAESKLKTMQDTLAEINKNEKDGILGRIKNNAMLVDKSALEGKIKAYQSAISLQHDLNNANEEGVEQSNKAIKSQQTLDKYIDAGTTSVEKRALAIKDLNQKIKENAANAAAGTATLWSAGSIAKARAGIEKLYRDPKVAKPKAYHDDQSTSMLKQEQERLATLKAENDALTIQDGKVVGLTDSAKRLAALDERINILRGQKRLSLQDQSVLRDSEALKAAILNTAQQEKLNQAKRRGLELDLSMEEYAKSIESSSAQKLAKYGLGSRNAERVDQQFQLKNAYERKGGKFDEGGNAIGAGADGYNKAKAAQDKFYEDDEKDRQNWQLGMQAGWQNFSDTASDTYSQVQSLTQDTLNNMSSSLTTFFTTGKADFKGFLVTFLKGIIQMIDELLVLKAVSSSMSFFGFGGKSNIPSNGDLIPAFPRNISYDTGGYTGDGGKYEPKGIVHGGEFVFTKEATQRLGVNNLYGMMRGYADGGLVTGTAPMHGLQGSGGTNVMVNSSVVVQNPQGQQTTATGNNDAVVRAYQKVIDKSVKDGIADSLRPGGLIWNAQNKR